MSDLNTTNPPQDGDRNGNPFLTGFFMPELDFTHYMVYIVV